MRIREAREWIPADVENEGPRAGRVPVRILEHADRPSRGLVLHYHGLWTSKEGHDKELTALAQAGFTAVGIDAVGHGERAFGDLRARLNDGDFETNLIHLVEQTAREVPGLVRALVTRVGETQGRVALIGISFGGYVAYRAVMMGAVARACVPIVASPDWSSVAPGLGGHALLEKSPHRRPHDWPQTTALLAINGGRDENVRPHGSRAFAAALTQGPRARGNVGYREYPESGHFFSPSDWDDAWWWTVEWLARWLDPRG